MGDTSQVQIRPKVAQKAPKFNVFVTRQPQPVLFNIDTSDVSFSLYTWCTLVYWGSRAASGSYLSLCLQAYLRLSGCFQEIPGCLILLWGRAARFSYWSCSSIPISSTNMCAGSSKVSLIIPAGMEGIPELFAGSHLSCFRNSLTFRLSFSSHFFFFIL